MKTEQLTINTYYYDTSINVVFQYLGTVENDHGFNYKFRTTKNNVIHMSKVELNDLEIITSI